jgi:capsular exopolysaccharide synthesis family protein
VTSVNLAHVLASLGGKVLLVDGDLRKPQGHLLLKARRTPGLSDVIVGVTRPSEAIQRPRHTTLSFLAAGSCAPSPADLLTTQAMRGFLQNLRGFYDWIVLDTPPVGPVAEALILAPLTDGVVVVVRAERVTRGAVRHTLERIGATGARVLGVVLNRARSDRQPAEYEHHYRHDYGSYGQAAPRAVSATVTPIYARRAAR